METVLSPFHLLKQKSLNRTKQYGNLSAKWKKITNSQYKSYYVVWKPPKPLPVGRVYVGLNRTMQYGNVKGKAYTMSQRLV